MTDLLVDKNLKSKIINFYCGSSYYIIPQSILLLPLLLSFDGVPVPVFVPAAFEQAAGL